MPLLTLPKIPEVSNSVLSASQLNTYRRALEYLLGKGHGTYAMNFATEEMSRYFTTYGTNSYDSVRMHLYHRKKTLYYAYKARADGTWYARFQFLGDDDSWHTVVEETGTGGSWSFQSGTADLSGETQMTAGEVYSWRAQIKTDSEDYNTYFRLIGMGEQASASGWVTPPTFTNTNTSQASDFNAIRTDAQALDTMLPPVTPTANMGVYGGESVRKVDQDSDIVYMRCAYRYKPDTILANVRTRSGNFGGSNTWKWKVELQDMSGNNATIYDSGSLTRWTDYAWFTTVEIDLTSGDAATAISDAGITLTEGDWYEVLLRLQREDEADSPWLRGQGGLLAVQTASSPADSWESMDKWTMGDDDIGNARLNKFSDNLTELYSGDEELWGQHPAVADGDSEWGEYYAYFGVHAKRWLIHREAENATVYYGPNFSDEYTLSDGDGWESFDMTNLPIPWGGVYYVTNVVAAWEADAPLI